MVKLDKEFLLDDAEEKFSQQGYVDESYALADECVDLAQQWFDENEDNLSGKRRIMMRVELKRYIKERLELTNERKAYFVPAFIWAWFAQQVITWIVVKIIEWYFNNYVD
tara:strand:+ start:88 stop:417 length:330 start_codon:yes stop_codon:yes gene_type:complete